jgi:hypothetical protein
MEGLMKRTLGIALVAGVAFLVAVIAEAQANAAGVRTKEEAIREIVKMTGAEDMGRQVMDQMRPALREAIPGLSDSFWNAFMAEIKPGEMTDLIVPVYSRHFTLDEIEQLIAFNKTPLGQKVIATMPLVMKECMAAGQEWGRELGERAYRKAQAQRSKSSSDK